MTSTAPAPKNTRPRGPRRAALATATTLALTLSGCGLGTAGGFVSTGELAGPLADVPSLDGAQIAVGSKNFTEQLLVGKMAVILFGSAGADVQDLTNIPGSSTTRQAQVSGELDMVWEYTGTAWIAYMGNTDPIPDEQEQWQAVADADREMNGLTWLAPAPMNNTYSMAVTQETVDEYGISSLSDIADVPVEDRTFCVEAEFNSRNDGLRPMLETYGVPVGAEVPEDNIRIFDTGAIYAATANGECTFGEVFTTDGRIVALDLTVLEDDEQFFAPYNISPVVEHEVLAQYPQIEQLFAPVSEKLTTEVMLDLNAQIDVEGRDPADVAYEWLTAEGFITPAA
jgi:osmoprotectant transport system substrate-binding protein